ncbi:MAG: lamin tail domain-containing protein, partial [Bacteroidales bacterium]|nr:lamin tail domain-containing protein [Bacteroidales bacterium]
MKKFTLLFLSLMLFSFLGAQNVVFHEGFEQPSGADSVTTYSSSGTNTWGISTDLAAGGLQSDSAVCSPNDTITLTTNAFSTTGNAFVTLDFDHIAKIQAVDTAIVEVSIDNGASWTRLDSTHYMGPSTKFGDNGNIFNVGAYPNDWYKQSPSNTIPQSSWWKHETFNISSIAADQSNVKIRFSLIDYGFNPSSVDDYAWFLDNIKIGAATSEMVPPEIVMIPPIIQDTVTSSSAQTIKAKITDDDSNVDTAFVVYYINGTLTDTLGMTNFQADTFQADIPFPGFGRTVTYFVEAIDDAAAQNHGTSNNYSYYLKSLSLPSPLKSLFLAEGFNGGGVPGNWDNNTQEPWAHETGSTTSGSTGPDGPYEGSGYVYTEASYAGIGSNATAELTSPAINLSNSNTPYLVFYYHMYGDDMGTLNVDVYDGSTWQQSVWSKTGQQHSSNGAPWTKVTIDLTSYKDAATKIRFRGITGSSYNSDMSVDAVMVGETQLNYPDAGLAEITNPTGGVVSNSNFDVKVKFQNNGDVNLNQVDIDWEVDGTAKSTYNWTGTLEPDSLSSEITLGTESVSSGAHNLKVWTANPNDTVDFNISNDTMHFSFYGCDNLLSGTYTIGGTSPDYATFTDAALALNQCGIDGAVTFNVAAGTYSEQITLSDINGASATNTITFQSATGDSSDVTLQYTAANAGENHVVKLEGTSYITFKDMTFKSQDNTWPRVFAMNSGADNISLTNNRFEGVDLSGGTSAADSALVIVEDSIGNGFTFTNNYLQGGTHGLNISGNGINNVTVTNNEFINQWSIGARINGANAPEIKNNRVETNSMHNSFNGIQVVNANGTFEIAYNEVYAASSIIGYGIRVESSIGDSLNHAQVYNNMATVRGVAGSTTISAGLINIESRFIDYYYNTFRTIGADELATPLCLYDNTAGETRYLTIKNNIFANNTEGHIIYTQNIDTAGFDHDYNNYYQTGSNLFGQFNGSDVDDFASFQSMTGQENNSVQYDPYFTDTTDLHIANNFLNNLGTPISGITDDIDGDSRDATNPDMGADEFDASPYDLAVLEVYGPQNSCGLSSAEDITLKVKNIGTSNINSFDASYLLLNDSTTVTETVNTTINAGDTLEYTFSATVDLDMSPYMKDSTFEFKAWTDHSSDPVPQNDSAATSVLSQYQPPAPTASNYSTNYGDSVTITATSNDTLVWYETDTSSNDIAKGKYFTTPPLYDTTDFWVEARSISNFVNIIGNGTNTQNYVPAYGYYEYGWSAQIINASELSGAAILDTIGFYVDNSPSNFEMLDQRIYIAHISNSEFTSTAKPDPSTMDYVFQGDLMYDGSGWKNIALDTPFDYNGSDHLVVYFENHNGSWSSGYPEWRSSLVSGNKVKYDYQDGSMPTTDGSFTSNRPNIRLVGKSLGCPSPRVPVTVNVTGIPTEDAGPVAMISPASAVQEGSQQYIDVEVKNYAVDPLTSLDISWELDGVHQKTYSWSGNINYKDTDTIRIDTASFTGGGHDIRFWTSQPNGTADTINSNDTLTTKFTACLHGTYTIGDTTGGNVYDYPSFTDAVNALNNAGICSSVTFQADSGVYNEQLHLTPIMGVDSANTVTFTSMSGDSTDVVVEYSGSSSNEHTIKLDSSKYITISHMTIKGLDANDAQVITLEAQSHNNKILNNVIEAAGTGSDAVPVYSSNSSGVNFNVIHNNSIINGNQSIFLDGNIGDENLGNIIEGNFLENFYEGGIVFENQDSGFVLNNTLITNTTYSSWNAAYAMEFNNADRIHVLNNKIAHNGTAQMIGINILYCEGTNAYHNLVANNFIAITGGSEENIGLQLDNSPYTDAYYNTVNITGGSDQSSALYLDVDNGDSPVRIVNNIFRDSVGYAVASEDDDGVTQMDYNNYYSESSNFIDWDGIAIADLSALQVETGMDANSHELLPNFVSSTDLHLTDKTFAGKGTALSAVTTDIDGKQRGSMVTTIGAHEVDLLPEDIGIANIINLPATITEFDSIAPHAVVINIGTDTIANYAIDYTVDGGTPVTKQITGDTILPYGHTDTIPLDTFVSPAGNYQLCATTVLSADSNQTNDQSCKGLFATPVIDGKVTHVDDLASGCNLTEDTIRITIKNMGIDTIDPGFDAKYQVDGTTLVTESVTSQILPNDSITFEFADLVDLSVTTFDSIYNIAAWVEIPNDNVAYNDTNYVETESMHTPATPIVDDVTLGIGSPVTLTGDATAPIHWFYQDTSSNAFYKGDTLQTDVLYSDTTFWFQAINSDDLNVSVGQGTATQNYTPAYGYYDYSWSAMIFEASEIASSGPIDTIGFYVDNTPSNYDMIDQRIYIAHISNSEFASAAKPDPSTMDYVFQGDLTYDGNGWKNIALDTPFDYNGNDHLLIYVENHDGSWSSGYPQWQSTAVTGDKVKYNYQDNSFPAANGTFQSERPNTRFVGAGSTCVSPRDSVHVNVVTPDFNAGISDIAVPSGCNLGMEPVTIDIVNLGQDTIDGGLTATFKVDNNAYISPENVPNVIYPFDTVSYTFNTMADLSGVSTGDTSYIVESYVSLTNDTLNYNDTIMTDTIHSLYTPAAPIAHDTTSIYGYSVTLTATSNDTLYWYENDSTSNHIGIGKYFTTPVLYDTTNYYVEASAASGQLVITEVTQYQLFGDGATSPEPSWLDGDDFVEITNLGSAPVSLDGYTHHREGSGDFSYNLPDITLDAGEVIVLATYGASSDDPTNNFYVAADNGVSSSTSTGHWLTNDNGEIVD